uniref:Proline rich membrane anchor 1 n=1 Tax=Erpetoichthys calabaricus TaxID=27687 RepID=A0A8C4XI38_ERPCA
INFTQGELQRSCSKTTEEKVGDNCHLICQCRIYPPLPPPPPPPPPPRLLVSERDPTGPFCPVELWRQLIGIIGMVGCASLVFLLIMVTVCYKAIKRKPLRKEENGTSQSEYAMTSRNKVMDANNTFA